MWLRKYCTSLRMLSNVMEVLMLSTIIILGHNSYYRDRVSFSNLSPPLTVKTTESHVVHHSVVATKTVSPFYPPIILRLSLWLRIMGFGCKPTAVSLQQAPTNRIILLLRDPVRTMPTPMSYLITLPIETLEQTLLCLSSQDIIKMQAVWRIDASSRRVVDSALRVPG